MIRSTIVLRHLAERQPHRGHRRTDQRRQREVVHADHGRFVAAPGYRTGAGRRSRPIASMSLMATIPVGRGLFFAMSSAKRVPSSAISASPNADSALRSITFALRAAPRSARRSKKAFDLFGARQRPPDAVTNASRVCPRVQQVLDRELARHRVVHRHVVDRRGLPRRRAAIVADRDEPAAHCGVHVALVGQRRDHDDAAHPVRQQVVEESSFPSRGFDRCCPAARGIHGSPARRSRSRARASRTKDSRSTGISSPISGVWPVLSWRAARLGWNPSSAITDSMRSIVSLRIRSGRPLSALETVLIDTPARCATSSIVIGLSSITRARSRRVHREFWSGGVDRRLSRADCVQSR